MADLNERLNLSLGYLIKNNVATSNELAEMLNVSSRTIKSDIIKINSLLFNHGAKIVSKRGCGYSLNVENQELFFDFLEDFTQDKKIKNIPENSKERSLYLIRKLLMIDFPIKIDELAEDVYVSRQTLKGDFRDAKILLGNYNLSLISNNEGVSIQGDEISKRRCICDLFFLRDSEFYAQNSEMFSSSMNQEEIRYIREALLFVLNKYKLRFSDLSIQNMVTHIMIAIRRYRFYQYVTFNEEKQSEIKNTVYYEAASCLKTMLENQFKVILPDNEAIYLAIHIKSKVIIEKSDITKKELYDMDELLYNIYHRVNKRFHISLLFDQSLSELLKLHIPAMVERIKNNLPMRNPQCTETIRRYQFASEICLEVVDEIQKEFNIVVDKNEFAYLVLYLNLALTKARRKMKQRIILVCGRGRPETIQIMNQLNEKFHALIDKIITLDIYDLDDFMFYDRDVLITTIPIIQNVRVPYIYVRSHIDDYYYDIYKTLLIGNLTDLDLKDILKKSDFLIDQDCETKEEVIELLNQVLKKEIGDSETSEIINNMYPDISEIGNGCAILHSLIDTRIPIVVTIKLKKPILWSSHYVQDIYFISVKTSGITAMEYLYKKISSLYEKEFRDIQEFEQLNILLKQ